MKRTTIILCLCLLCLSSWAQNSVDNILEQVKRNNLSLKAQKQVSQSNKLSVAAEYSPLENTEVEVSPFVAASKDASTRCDVSIMQEFAFPSTYLSQKKIVSLSQEKSEMEYIKTERQTLQEARQLCTQIIYCNRMQKALQERKQRAQMVFDYTNRMQQSGEVSLMESNSAKLFLVQITHAIQNNDFEIKSLLRQLQSLNGGKAIVLADTIYPNSLANKDMMSNNYIDSLISSCIANNPELQSLNIDKEIAEKEVRLAKSQYLPSLALGYKGELSQEGSLHGIGVGVSLPLFSNSKKVQAAKAKTSIYSLLSDDAMLQFSSVMHSTYDNIILLKEIIDGHKQTLQEIATDKMLEKALTYSEISPVQYYQDLNSYYEIVDEILSLEKDYQLLLNELLQYTR